MEEEKWTDEELIQVYDLQEKYAEVIVDFVRHGAENDVLKFLLAKFLIMVYYLLACAMAHVAVKSVTSRGSEV